MGTLLNVLRRSKKTLMVENMQVRFNFLTLKIVQALVCDLYSPIMAKLTYKPIEGESVQAGQLRGMFID